MSPLTVASVPYNEKELHTCIASHWDGSIWFEKFDTKWHRLAR